MKYYLAILATLFILSFEFVKAEEEVPCVSIEMPMRDGVVLPTDIYLPDLEARGLPCILIRAPNGRESHCKKYAPLAKKGYAVVIQDTRSKIDPEGKTMPYEADGWGTQQDGYDAVQWLANSPYTNGKIGTLGVSAQGITQLLLAPACPPNLVCQHIGVAAASLYHHAMFIGGGLQKNQVESWLGYYAPHPAVFQHVSSQPFYNSFWECFNTPKVADKVNVPAIHHGGWYDTFCQGTIDSFMSRQHKGREGAKGTQKLIIGPWPHFWPDIQTFGDFTLPENALKAPIDFSPELWFDYYLKGSSNEIKDLPTVTYYVMGPFDGSPSSGNVWRSADHWPPKSEPTSFYLSANGTLTRQVPKKGYAKYAYNPADPCPTLGGRNLFLKSGPVDQRSVEARDDVLVFTSEPLQEDTEVTGRIMAQLLFSTDVEDTDVVVTLTDVYPDGKSVLISDGLRRLSSVLSSRMAIGKAKGSRLLDVDLWSTSIVFAKGHRIRVTVTSSNYPRYERATNLAPGAPLVNPLPVANNVVHFGGLKGSRIILPLVKYDRQD